MCVPFIPSINNCNLSFLCSLIWFTLSTSETEREPTRPRLALPRPRLPPSLELLFYCLSHLTLIVAVMFVAVMVAAVMVVALVFVADVFVAVQCRHGFLSPNRMCTGHLQMIHC